MIANMHESDEDQGGRSMGVKGAAPLLPLKSKGRGSKVSFLYSLLIYFFRSFLLQQYQTKILIMLQQSTLLKNALSNNGPRSCKNS